MCDFYMCICKFTHAYLRTDINMHISTFHTLRKNIKKINKDHVATFMKKIMKKKLNSPSRYMQIALYGEFKLNAPSELFSQIFISFPALIHNE